MMQYSQISVGAFGRQFIAGLWGVRNVVGAVLVALVIDSALMLSCGGNASQALREIIGWFFGNGGRVQELSWVQLACCILAAICGYIFLGVVLAVTVKSFEHAERRDRL